VKNGPLSNVLTSSIGGAQTAPIVKRLPNSWSTVHLLCTDGLTKHVSDARIAERLGGMTSAKEVCEQLLQDALDGGATDNITIVVGRPVAAKQLVDPEAVDEQAPAEERAQTAA
jgi:serine/threonine protein phosphatase PrpC